jgi:hypothetical protein
MDTPSYLLAFAGSSHTRTMLLDLLLFITGSRPDSRRMASRQYFCKNQDGMDIDSCGWPSSAQWLLQRDAILEHTLQTEPAKNFPDQPGNADSNCSKPWRTIAFADFHVIISNFAFAIFLPKNHHTDVKVN